MQIVSRKNVSRLLAFVLTLSTVLANISYSALAANGRKTDVWDFGGIQQEGTLYENHISTETWDNFEGLSGGKFIAAGSHAYGDLTLNVNNNDRVYYFNKDGSTGKNGYGTSAIASYSYTDYKPNGMLYYNGTGGNNRRNFNLKNVVKGDKVTVYVTTSNSATDEEAHFQYLGSDGVQDSTGLFSSGVGNKIDFIAEYSGEYLIWFGTGTGGKPCVHRITRTPGVEVTGAVNLGSHAISGYGITFTNVDTQTKTDAIVENNSYTAILTPGYTYSATITNAAGYGISSETRRFSVDDTEILTGKTADLNVIETNFYEFTGSIKGFAANYEKLANLKINLIADPESYAENTVLTINSADLTYSTRLEENVEYTAELEGVNDYEITNGGTFVAAAAGTQDVNVALKPMYTASGSFVGLPESAAVTELSFENVDDGYTYTAVVNGSGYTAELRDGAYSAIAVCSDADYVTSSHVVVDGANTSKDLKFSFTGTEAPLPLVKDLYVGYNQADSYDTVSAAVKAAKLMSPASEDNRITIHIAPGIYREQITIDTPYITLINDSATGEAKLTWYYGIGYKYYSMGSDGYYSEDAAFDKYSKGLANTWGCAVNVTKNASDFKAENIVFENSFNKYVTEEELADGVEPDDDPSTSITFTRRLYADVTAKTATERAAAAVIKGTRAEFYNCSFIGSQDTLYTDGAEQYFKNCFIEGNTDYIFGDNNAVFDNCQLNFCGYSDTASSGYLTALKDNGAYGYLFRNCYITENTKNEQSPNYFGRPWGANAKVTFMNTKLDIENAINSIGWTSMSGNTPENANFKEYNTTYNGTAIDTTGRTAGTVMSADDAKTVDVEAYFGDWTPTYYTASSAAAPEITKEPYFYDSDDINLPRAGHVLTAVYEMSDPENDSSLIQWYRVAEDGTETLVKSSVAFCDSTYTIQTKDVDHYIKAVITPENTAGLKGEAAVYTLENVVLPGSSSGGSDDKPVDEGTNIYIAGDSTVKTYTPSRSEGGWGEYLQKFFDSEYVNIVNYTNGGRSSRSFINEGSLDKIASTIKEGDYLFVQFGHNDCANQSGYLEERFVSLGEPDANGIYPVEEGVKSATPSNLVNTYGEDFYPYTTGTYKWYLKQYIETAKNAGATPVLVTPVSRMYYTADGTIRTHHDATDTTTGTVTTSNNAYVTAVLQLAEEENVPVIDMFDVTKSMYEEIYKEDPNADSKGSPYASQIMFDGTHYNKIGGFYVGALITKEMKAINLPVAKAIIKPTIISGIDSSDTEAFSVDNTGNVTVYTAEGNSFTSVPNEYWTSKAQEAVDSLAKEVIYGDVNNDSSITAQDAAIVLNYVLDKKDANLSIDAVNAAKVASDDTITAANSLMILKKSLDDSYVFPALQ